MQRTISGTLVCLLLSGCSLLTVSAGSVLAQDGTAVTTPATETLPSAKEVMEKYLEATGGREAYGKLTNRIVLGTVDIPTMGLKGSSSITQAAPNKMLMKMDFAGMGSQTQGSDGEVVWEGSTMMGYRILEGPERASATRLATFNSELNWDKMYKSITVVGEEMVDGKPAYKLDMVTTDDQKSSSFYDKETGLLVKSVSTVKGQMGDLDVESVLSDYREIDGIKMPFKTTQSAMGNTFTITLESVQHNVDLPADTFAIPAEVKALQGGAPAEGQTPPSDAKPTE